MQQLPAQAIDQHNRLQRQYFERTLKRTMVPVGSPYLRRHINELLHVADVKPGERMLEVGCGMGRYTLLLAERGIRVEGLDLTPALLHQLQGYGGAQADIPLLCADILAPPGLSGQYDVVACFFTLHHLHDVAGCIMTMAGLLKPGGRLVFLEPNPANPLYYVQILLTPRMEWKAERNMLLIRPDIIHTAMERAGLVRPQVMRFGFFPPFLANRSWGPRVEALLERVPFWRRALPFQIFWAELPVMH